MVCAEYCTVQYWCVLYSLRYTLPVLALPVGVKPENVHGAFCSLRATGIWLLM